MRNVEVSVGRCECLGLNFVADGEDLLLELHFGKVKPDNISSWNETELTLCIVEFLGLDLISSYSNLSVYMQT